MCWACWVPCRDDLRRGGLGRWPQPSALWKETEDEQDLLENTGHWEPGALVLAPRLLSCVAYVFSFSSSFVFFFNVTGKRCTSLQDRNKRFTHLHSRSQCIRLPQKQRCRKLKATVSAARPRAGRVFMEESSRLVTQVEASSWQISSEPRFHL